MVDLVVDSLFRGVVGSNIAVCRLVGRVQAAKSKKTVPLSEQWLNNRTVYLDFAAFSLHSSNQPALLQPTCKLQLATLH